MFFVRLPVDQRLRFHFKCALHNSNQATKTMPAARFPISDCQTVTEKVFLSQQLLCTMGKNHYLVFGLGMQPPSKTYGYAVYAILIEQASDPNTCRSTVFENCTNFQQTNSYNSGQIWKAQHMALDSGWQIHLEVYVSGLESIACECNEGRFYFKTNGNMRERLQAEFVRIPWLLLSQAKLPHCTFNGLPTPPMLFMTVLPSCQSLANTWPVDAPHRISHFCKTFGDSNLLQSILT